MEKKTYKVTRDDIDWIAGKRVKDDRTIDLTERDAFHDLSRSNIELLAPEAENAPEAVADAGADAAPGAAKGKKRGEG